MSVTDPPMPDDDDYVAPPPVVKNPPRAIWLNVGELEQDCDFGELDADMDGVTWCSQPQWISDVHYVRADLVKAVMPTNWREDADWLPLAKALKVIP